MIDDILQRYALISHLLLACSLGHTSISATGFYEIVTSFLANKTCLAILYNYGLMLFLYGCKVPIIIFLGQLSQLEKEQLIENARNYVMDAVLFLVLSKPRFNGKEVIMFELVKYLTLLVALKCFHIMLYTRLSHMFQVEIPDFLKLIRILSLIYVLSLINCCLLNIFWEEIDTRDTFIIWIVFELFGMLQACLFCTFKYIINVIDLYYTNGLTNKITLLFYVDLFHDISTLLSFLIFMIIFFVNNPINVPVYMLIDALHVAKNLSNRIRMLLYYRRLSKVLDTRFPDPTSEDLERDGTCIICRDTLVNECKKIDCGHVFHLTCLKSWLFQHSSCPSCRARIDSESTPSVEMFDLSRFLLAIELGVIRLLKRARDSIANFINKRKDTFKNITEEDLTNLEGELLNKRNIKCNLKLDFSKWTTDYITYNGTTVHLGVDTADVQNEDNLDGQNVDNTTNEATPLPQDVELPLRMLFSEESIPGFNDVRGSLYSFLLRRSALDEALLRLPAPYRVGDDFDEFYDEATLLKCLELYYRQLLHHWSVVVSCYNTFSHDEIADITTEVVNNIKFEIEYGILQDDESSHIDGTPTLQTAADHFKDEVSDNPDPPDVSGDAKPADGTESFSHEAKGEHDGIKQGESVVERQVSSGRRMKSERMDIKFPDNDLSNSLEFVRANMDSFFIIRKYHELLRDARNRSSYMGVIKKFLEDPRGTVSLDLSNLLFLNLAAASSILKEL